ncbi:MAG: hypothetical protein L0Z53_16690 [Acidobacteriales bacterium]|nr:hypothetical protein [Terriglobales bacterium]
MSTQVGTRPTIGKKHANRGYPCPLPVVLVATIEALSASIVDEAALS